MTCVKNAGSIIGVWLSLVERLVRDQEAVCSNHITPTTKHQNTAIYQRIISHRKAKNKRSRRLTRALFLCKYSPVYFNISHYYCRGYCLLLLSELLSVHSRRFERVTQRVDFVFDITACSKLTFGNEVFYNEPTMGSR